MDETGGWKTATREYWHCEHKIGGYPLRKTNLNESTEKRFGKGKSG
jgi:hypothetical protein